MPTSRCAPLDKAVAKLKASAKASTPPMRAPGVGLAEARRGREAQRNLARLDETLLSPGGLPGRPWYENLIYAPGLLTGYGSKTLPGVREAIEGRRWAETDRYAALTADVLNAYSDRLDQATAVLGAK